MGSLPIPPSDILTLPLLHIANIYDILMLQMPPEAAKNRRDA